MRASVDPSEPAQKLSAFLEATTDEATRQALGQLLEGGLLDLVQQVVRQELGRSRRTAGAIDDVAAEVRLRLVRRLLSWKDGREVPVDNLPAYARTLSVHTCYGYLRRTFPERTRLRNRIRYVLTHHPGLALEEHGPAWRTRATTLRAAPQAGATRLLQEDPVAFADAHRLSPQARLSELIPAVLRRCDQPVDLEDLVEAVAKWMGVTDLPPKQGHRDPEWTVEDVADPEPAISDRLVQRQALALVWTELAALPQRQRSALLLNLRDADGSALLQALPSTGVATMEAIAAALGLDDGELARLWPDLPLDDLTIAARLGITRQQVINLRKSGRARLARRAGNMPARPASIE